jgi:WD40 repeat protein
MTFGENESLIGIDLQQNFATGYRDHLLLKGGEIYDISASKIVCTIPQNTVCICISPDRQYICAGNGDGEVRFYDYQSGDLLYVLPTKLPCAVACIDWSPFEDMIAFTGSNGEKGASLPILLYAAPEGQGESFRDWSTRWKSHVPDTEGLNVREMKERILNSIISSQKYSMTSSDE